MKELLRVKKMNEALASIRKTHKTLEEPGFMPDMVCVRRSKSMRTQHINAMEEAVSSACKAGAGKFSIKVDTGLGKTYTLAFTSLDLISRNYFKPSDILFISQNNDLSAKDSVLKDHPELEGVANSLQYITYSQVMEKTEQSVAMVQSLFSNAKVIICDEAHSSVTPCMRPIMENWLTYADTKVFLFASAISSRFDDEDEDTVNYFENTLGAECLYSISTNEAIALSIYLSPIRYSISKSESILKFFRDIYEKSGHKAPSKTIMQNLNNFSQDELQKLLHAVSSKHIQLNANEIVDKFWDYLNMYNITGKIRVLAVGNTLDDKNYEVNNIKSFFSRLEVLTGKKVKYIVEDYTSREKKSEKRNNLVNFESDTYGVEGDDCITVHILYGVYAVARSIHPSNLHLLFLGNNPEASTLREQLAGRCVSIGNSFPVFVVDPLDSLTYGIFDSIFKNLDKDRNSNKVSNSYLAFEVFTDLSSLYDYSELEFSRMSEEEIEIVVSYILDNFSNYADPRFYSDAYEKLGVSSATLKLLIENFGLYAIKFKNSRECVDILMSKLAEVSLRNEDNSITLTSGNTLTECNGKLHLNGIYGGIDLNSVFENDKLYEYDYYTKKIDEIISTLYAFGKIA